MTFHAVELVTAVQHSIEFVDEHGDGLVAFVGLDGGIHVGALYLDVAFRLELNAGRGGAIAFQFHADAHDALLVSKQSLGFLTDERLERRCQVEMDARYD